MIIVQGASRVQHDSNVCGIDPEWDCPACRARQDANDLARWPHLAVPGPQPWNQLPPLSAYQVLPSGGLMLPPRKAEPLPRDEAARLAATVQAYPEVFLPILLEQLAEPLGELFAVLKSQEQPKREGVAA